MAQTQDEPRVRTFDDVSRENNEWTAQADQAMASFDVVVEGKALISMLYGETAAEMKAACESLNQSSKWDAAQQVWKEHLQQTPADKLGGAVRGVIDTLEAPHLRPSGIQSRLMSGVKPSCFGLFSLMQHLAPAASAGDEDGGAGAA
jgi:hypothetical protein